MLNLAPETEALIRAKASITGKSPDEVIVDALARISASASTRAVDRQGLSSLLAELDRLPERDPRSAKQIRDEGWGL